jgi:enoyl-CoA hydratase
MTHTYENLTREDIGSVTRINVNRPQVANAQDRATLDELDATLRQLADDDAVRVVIIGGEGKHFSSGHDLAGGLAVRPGHEDEGFTTERVWFHESKYYLEYCLAIRNFPKPTIAQVQGAAIAGGFMVANMCDLIVASEDAWFSDPVVQGMAAAGVEILVHPWVMSSRRAREMLYTGDRITALEALEIGMINRVVPRDQLETVSVELATKIAQAYPFATRLVKRSLNLTQDMMGFTNALQAHFATHDLSHQSLESAEMRANRTK